MTAVSDRATCAARDADDPLARVRDRFTLPEGLVYLDGNSLGALPAQTPGRVAAAVEEEWGQGLIRSWTDARWIEMPGRVGAKLARLIGAGAGEVVVAESTTVCLFKLVGAALAMVPDRLVVLTEEENFHTDLYVAAGAARLAGASVRVVPRERLLEELDEEVAVLLLTHVDYRTGFMHDMRALSAAAHQAGALVIWDLCHSVGAVPLRVNADGADMAVGCGYKYLNGGPGAPALLHVNERLHPRLRNPIPGWLGHAEPFAFEPAFRPAPGLGSMITGSPHILQLVALESGVDLWLEVDMAMARAKSIALTDLFISLVEDRCAAMGFSLASPRSAAQRGSQVSFHHPHGYGVVRGLIERGVIGDFRAPDICRFGFAPLYLRYVDVWDAVDRLVGLLAAGDHLDSRFAERAAIT
ncbi:MAG TPA: kynureninase [Candidatus Dormibacteraeota bacterium]|nr:kynureninase [Candidatus Dormibacteraeota bacterium]